MERRDDSLDLPEGLKGDLRGLYTPGGAFRGDDARILKAARTAGVRRVGHRWAIGMGIAAAVAIAAGLFALQGGHIADSRGPQAAMSPAAHPEVNGPTGDIRDAFYVARELKAHGSLEGRWDANHDGVVDARDVQALAVAAVRVEGVEKGEVR